MIEKHSKGNKSYKENLDYVANYMFQVNMEKFYLKVLYDF